jgi:hypothetical protein
LPVFLVAQPSLFDISLSPCLSVWWLNPLSSTSHSHLACLSGGPTLSLRPVRDGIHAGKGKEATLVDMPGYGFAYAAEETVKEWTELMHRYVAEPRRVVKRVYLLLDGRHGAKHVDKLFMERLDAAGSRFTCVLTKVRAHIGSPRHRGFSSFCVSERTECMS